MISAPERKRMVAGPSQGRVENKHRARIYIVKSCSLPAELVSGVGEGEKQMAKNCADDKIFTRTPFSEMALDGSRAKCIAL